MTALLLFALLRSNPQLSPEVSAGAGFGGAAYAFNGGRWGDSLFSPYALGRGLLGPVVGELELLVSAPLTSNSAGLSFTAIPRLGYSGQTWSLLIGASVQLAPNSISVFQVLPSFRFRKNLGEYFGFSVGIFDLHGLAPAHLSVELGSLDLGYVAPLGATLGARIRIPWKDHTLQLRAIVFRLLNTEVALFTLGIAWGGES